MMHKNKFIMMAATLSSLMMLSTAYGFTLSSNTDNTQTPIQTPNYSQAAKQVSNAVVQSQQVQAKQQVGATSNDPFAPLNAVVKQGLQVPTQSHMSQPTAPAINQQPVNRPAATVRPTTPTVSSQPTQPKQQSNVGISGVSSEQNDGSSNGIQLQF